MQFIDLAAQTRLLGQTAHTLETLRTDVEQVRAGEISKPVRDLAPLTIRTQQLATRCTQQLSVLSTSQYAAMKNGHENLASLAEMSAQVSIAATMCTLAIHNRTEVLLYEDADETPEASRRALGEVTDRMELAAKAYRRLAQSLSRRLASTAAQREDQRLIDQALDDRAAPAAGELAQEAHRLGQATKPASHPALISSRTHVR
ncbi:hypothetical protein ABZ820_04875 [Streptomyces diacarni]|uniref:hypothetical protein n=1 Tax=Streptomyces diacarni TaxID=2800381 RepID=UPI0033C7B743